MNKAEVFRRKFSTVGIVCIILVVGVAGAVLYYTVSGRNAVQGRSASNTEITDDPSSFGLGEPFYEMPHYYDWDLHWLGGSNVVPLHHP